MSRYIGIVDFQAVFAGIVECRDGDTFVVESADCCGCHAYRRSTGFRTGCGIFNNFERLHSGLRTACITKAEEAVR
jgi:hypothetical protein